MSSFLGIDEEGSLVAQAVKRAQTVEFLKSLAADPVGATRLAQTLSHWGEQAPTLPAGALYGLASAGIGPDHPVGQQIIRNGLSVVPPMSQYQMRVASTSRPTDVEAFQHPTATSSSYMAAEAPPGLRAQGNLDIYNRPILHNPDGSYSTTSSFSISTDQGETLIPSVINGRRYSQKDAIAHYMRTGENLGVFDTPDHADSYATMLHNTQAAHVDATGGPGTGQLPPEGYAGQPDSFTPGGIAKPKSRSLLGDLGHVAENVGGFINRDVGRPVGALINKAQTINTQTAINSPVTAQDQQVQQQSSLPTTEGLKTVSRVAGAAANSGLEAVKLPLNVVGSGVSTLRGNPEGETVRGPFGTQYHFGSLKQAVDPDQFQIVQAARGKSLGQGILPGGEAVAASTKAQQAAGNINGHALTYGRALASVVASPDTRAYNVVSGVTDFGVAQELDPTAWLAKTLSDSTAAGHIFSETTDASRAAVADHLIAGATTPEQIAGLEDWAGGGEAGATVLRNSGAGLREAVMDRMRSDPMGMATVAQRLDIADPKSLMRAAKAPQTGVFMGLRPVVHRQSVLSYALSDQSTKDFQKLADENSFTKLRTMMGHGVPVDVVAQVAQAHSVDDIRFLVNDEMGLSIPGPGVKAIRPWQDSRLAAMLPDHFADLTDAQQRVESAERTMASANVPRSVQDPILEQLALARTQGEAWDVYVNKMGSAVADKLAQDDKIGHLISAPGVPVDKAKKLTTFYADQSAEQHLFNIDESGRDARVTVSGVDGEPVPLTGPHLETEMGRYVPSLDPVALRQATTKWRQAIHMWNDGYVTDAEGFAGGASRAAHSAARAERYFMGAITGVWKLGVLSSLRLPLRIGGEEQAAASVAGLDSFWTNPASMLSMIAGAKEGHLQNFLDKLPGIHAAGSADVLGNHWADFLGDQKSAYSRWLGQAAGDVPSPWSTEQQILKRYTLYNKSQPDDYRRGWIDELSHLHLDPVSREVSRALLDPENYAPAGVEGHTGLDAVKDWVKTGPGAEYLNDLMTSHSEDPNSYIEMLRSGQMTPEEWVDSIADRVKTKTAGDQKLLHAVGYNKDPETGDRPFDFSKVNQKLSKSVSKPFRDYIKANVDNGPEKVRALAAVRSSHPGSLLGWYGDKLMGALMDSPSKVITRSPMGRQFYYQEIQRMFGQLTPEAQTAALEQAASDGWKLTKGAGSGAADLEHVDAIAKARTLSKLHDYLYYPGEKNTAESMLSNLAPFAGAWHSALKRWSKLTIEHPQVVRRVQQGVQQLQSQGVFYKNADGKEVFGIFGPGIMRELAGSTGTTLEGPVAGLNILGQGLPGPGLGVQAAAELMIPHVSSTVAVRNFISPYGEPDFSGGWQMIMPGWLQKMSAGQFQPIKNIPYVGPAVGGALSKVFPRSDSQTTSVQDLAKQQFAAMAISGAYNMRDSNVQPQMWKLANQRALNMYFWRGMAQMVIPTAPTYSTKVVPKNGTAAGTGIFLQKIGAELRAAQDANGGDFDKAFAGIVKKFGPEAIYATEPQNLRTVYGVPTTVQGEAWQEAHPDFVSKYGNVWGYFAPQGPGFNQVVYHDEMNKGLIQSLTVAQWAQEANQQLGGLVYNSVRTALGPSISKSQQAGLDGFKAQLAKDYPGYTGNVAGLATKADSTQKIAELSTAVKDPLVKNTPLAKATETYLLLRQAMLDQSGKKSFSDKGMETYAQQATEIGAQLVNKVPEFGNIWDSIFQYEVTNG